MNLPSFYTSEYYKKPQEYLLPYSQNILEGKIPEYYKGIGESGGELFDEYMRRITGDVSRGVTEDLARRGIRGERGAGIIAGKVGDVSSTMNWNDYVRAMTGRENLLKYGAGMMGDVRSAGLTEQGQQNQFSLGRANLELNQEQFQQKMDFMKEQQEQQMWTDLLSSGIGAIGNVASMGMLGGFNFLGSAAGGGTPANSTYDVFLEDLMGDSGMSGIWG